jgi:hypothetical protein
MTAHGLPTEKATTLGNLAENDGPTDGVSQTATAPPTSVLTTLAAAGRNPTDIMLPTFGSEGSGGEGSGSPLTAAVSDLGGWAPITSTDTNLQAIAFVGDGPKDYGMTPEHDRYIHGTPKPPPKGREYVWNTSAGGLIAQQNATAAAGVDGFGAAAEGARVLAWADQKSTEMAPLLSAKRNERLEQKDVQNALQHACWIALLYILYGENDARTLAWIHEKHGSDGWLDTLRDFYNNNRGIEIGKEVEKLLGADAVSRLRNPPEQLGGLGPIPAAPGVDLDRARELIQAKVLEALGEGKLVVSLSEVTKNPKVLPDVIRDAQRFWDQTVYYNPFRQDIVPARGSELKPTNRPGS